MTNNVFPSSAQINFQAIASQKHAKQTLHYICKKMKTKQLWWLFVVFMHALIRLNIFACLLWAALVCVCFGPAILFVTNTTVIYVGSNNLCVSSVVFKAFWRAQHKSSQTFFVTSHMSRENPRRKLAGKYGGILSRMFHILFACSQVRGMDCPSWERQAVKRRVLNREKTSSQRRAQRCQI